MLHDIPVCYWRRNILTRYKYNFNERTEISRLSLYIFLTICRLKRIPSTATYIVDDDECIDRLQSASLENASILASRDRQRDINHINRRIDRTVITQPSISFIIQWHRPTLIYLAYFTHRFRPPTQHSVAENFGIVTLDQQTSTYRKTP